MTEDNAPRDAGRDALALDKSHESKAYQGRRGDNGIQSLALRTNPKHFIVTIPEVPGFAGNLKDEGSLKIIMAAQYRTINRGGRSIYEEIRKAGFEP